MKSLKQLHHFDKQVSAQRFFSSKLGISNSIQLKAGGELKEHFSKTSAVLLCVSGAVEYEDETGIKLLLRSTEYVDIVRDVKHKLKAIEESQLILLT